MPDERQAEELRDEQTRRFERERRKAERSDDEAEAAQHERRAEKAGYLAGKLEERALRERGS